MSNSIVCMQHSPLPSLYYLLTKFLLFLILYFAYFSFSCSLVVASFASRGVAYGMYIPVHAYIHSIYVCRLVLFIQLPFFYRPFSNFTRHNSSYFLFGHLPNVRRRRRRRRRRRFEE